MESVITAVLSDCSQNPRVFNVSSKAAMESNCWRFSFTHPDGDAGVEPFCGGGSNWYGWSDGNAVGTLTSPTLKGSGLVVLEYGNCGNAGTVKLYQNDKLIDTASPNPPYLERAETRVQILKFKNGDIMKLKDEDGNAVINLKYFSVACAPTPSPTTAAQPTAALVGESGPKAPNWRINVIKKVHNMQLDGTLKAQFMKLIACSTSTTDSNAQSNCCVEKIGPQDLTPDQEQDHQHKIASFLREM